MRLGHGEAENGGRERLPLLGSTFEALIGAIYLDQDISEVWKFMDPILETKVRNIIASQVEHHPKSISTGVVTIKGIWYTYLSNSW